MARLLRCVLSSPVSLSNSYSKWVLALHDPNFDRTDYTDRQFAEALTINTLAAALIGAAVVMAAIVSYPKFRYRPRTVVAVSHDRYG